MMYGLIEMPNFKYLKNGNIWTGSMYREFNFKIYPLKKDEPPELKTIIWFGKKSIDNVSEEEYYKILHHEFSEAGFDKLMEDLNAEIKEFGKTHRTIFYY